MRLLALPFLICCQLFAQAVTNPANPTSNPNQIAVTNSYLYLNKLHYAGTWSAIVIYNSQDVVFSASVPYISIQVSNLNNAPASSPLWWTPVPSGVLPTFPAGAIVGTTDTQSLTNKTLDGISPAIMGFLATISSDIQTQVTGKQAALGFTAENAANKDAVSGYAGLTSGSLLKTAELPAFTGDVTKPSGSVVTTVALVGGATAAAVALASTAVPVVARLSLTGQSAAISTTTIYTPGSAGTFRLCISVWLTTNGTGGNIGMFGVANGGLGASGAQQIPVVNAAASANGNGGGCVVMRVAAASNLQYLITFNAVTGSPVYSADFTVEQLK